MTVVIRCWGFANGDHCPHKGQYLESFTHSAYDGRGYGEFTIDIDKAKSFASMDEALRFYRAVPWNKSTRPDGRPNRPLTAMHCEFVKR